LLTLAFVASVAVPAATAAEIPLAERRSGYEFMGRETQAMQDDDVTNPGLLWVLDGEALWSRKDGAAGKSCADCHGDARTTMKGVAARYPAWDEAGGRPDQSRAAHQFLPQRRQQRRALATKAGSFSR
jgi:sulfur-oxidizing protein SoxA